MGNTTPDQHLRRWPENDDWIVRWYIRIRHQDQTTPPCTWMLLHGVLGKSKTVSLLYVHPPSLFAPLTGEWWLNRANLLLVRCPGHVTHTHLQCISSNSIHELDKLSGSTPKTVIHTPFDIGISRFRNAKRNPGSRNKEIKRNSRHLSMGNTTPVALARKRWLNL
jgi:hypothetical protein